MATTSDSSGQFAFPELAPGNYLLEATAPGLTLRAAQTLTLTSGERKDIRLNLAIAAITTLVSVTSDGLPQPVEQVSKALTDVNLQEAQQHGLISAADALQFVPGFKSVRKVAPAPSPPFKPAACVPQTPPS